MYFTAVATRICNYFIYGNYVFCSECFGVTIVINVYDIVARSDFFYCYSGLIMVKNGCFFSVFERYLNIYGGDSFGFFFSTYAFAVFVYVSNGFYNAVT